MFTGKKLDQVIDLDQLIKQDNRQDTIALKANCGVIQTFMLNQVLTMPGFLQAFEGDFRNESSKKNKSISGQKLLDALKGKKEQNKT